jgi:hypothetical protein
MLGWKRHLNKNEINWLCPRKNKNSKKTALFIQIKIRQLWKCTTTQTVMPPLKSELKRWRKRWEIVSMSKKPKFSRLEKSILYKIKYKERNITQQRECCRELCAMAPWQTEPFRQYNFLGMGVGKFSS